MNYSETHDMAVGPDDIHSQFLKSLPRAVLNFL